MGCYELAVCRRSHPVDVPLGVRDSVVIEPADPLGYLLDLVVEPVVGDQPVQVPIPFRARPVEIVCREQDLKRPRATDEARGAGPQHRPRG